MDPFKAKAILIIAVLVVLLFGALYFIIRQDRRRVTQENINTALVSKNKVLSESNTRLEIRNKCLQSRICAIGKITSEDTIRLLVEDSTEDDAPTVLGRQVLSDLTGKKTKS